MELSSLKIVDDDIQLELISGSKEIVQSIERILSTRKGEFFLSAGFGLNYNNFYKKQPNLELVELDIREAIFQDFRVEEILSIDLAFSDTLRKLTVNFRIKAFNTFIESEVTI